MAIIYITGGQQKKRSFLVQEWNRYQKGLILSLDTESLKLQKCVDYISPPQNIPVKQNSVIFKCGDIWNGKLYVCTSTEILIYRFPKFEQLSCLSLPCFNDLHHVKVSPRGTLFAVSTGLDLVFELTENGEILNEWNVLGQDPWVRFSRNVDYRKIATTKPHQSHPNHVFFLQGEAWVTRFNQKDAICLTNFNRRISIDVEHPHDGAIFEGSVYFTTVDGHIVIVNACNLKVEKTVDLNSIILSKESLGWCRGLKILNKDYILVSFSRIRPTKIHENIHWVKHKLSWLNKAKTMPTRICLFNILKRRLEWEVEVESEGINAIFSIL